MCPHLELLSFLKPLTSFSDGVFQEETVREVSGDAGCFFSSSTKGFYGVWGSVVSSKNTNDVL